MHKQIFIGGTGRSGTSICYEFLASHRDIHGFGLELRFLIDYNGLLNVVDALSSNYSHVQAREALWNLEKMMKIDLTNRHKPPYIGIDFYQLFGKTTYLEIVDSFFKLLSESVWCGTDYQVESDWANTYFPKLTRKLEPFLSKANRVFKRLCQQSPLPQNLWPKRVMRNPKYFADRSELCKICGAFVDSLFTAAAVKHGKTHWCEKTPHNILHIDFIYEILPKSYFIHMIRDPRGVAHSYRHQFWASDSLTEVCHILKNTYRRWFDLKEKIDFTKYKYIEYKLEECARDTRSFVSSLCDFLGVPDSFVDPPQLNVAKVDYWKEQLPVKERLLIEQILGFAIKKLGYPL